jgi:hypothetical protein
VAGDVAGAVAAAVAAAAGLGDVAASAKRDARSIPMCKKEPRPAANDSGGLTVLVPTQAGGPISIRPNVRPESIASNRLI